MLLAHFIDKNWFFLMISPLNFSFKQKNNTNTSKSAQTRSNRCFSQMLDQKEHKNNRYKFQAWIFVYKTPPSVRACTSGVSYAWSQWLFFIFMFFLLVVFTWLVGSGIIGCLFGWLFAFVCWLFLFVSLVFYVIHWAKIATKLMVDSLLTHGLK